MQTTRHILNHHNLQLEYLLTGNGSKLVICFPGFGRPATDFDVFHTVFQPDYTLCCVNHFFHFNSRVTGRNPLKSPLKQEELTALIKALLKQLGHDRFSLMGYSLGGRICLSVAQLFPLQVDKLILLAPDGIIKGRWYVFTTHTYLGRWLYRRFMNNNDIFFKLLSRLRRWGIISQKIHDFVRNNTATPERQKLVYEVWLFLRNIEPDLVLLGRQLAHSKPPVLACFGRYDKIILPVNGERLKKHLPWARVKILNAGHRLMTNSTGRVLADGEIG